MNFSTNVIVLSLPKRMDLEDQSCVNKEMMNFNRQLGKHLKSFEYAHFVEVNYDRKYYTRHGLHLNIKSKEHVIKRLETVIKVILNKSDKTVIPLNWKKAQLKDEIRRCKNKGRDSCKDLGVLSSGEEKQLGKIPPTLPCKRIRPPSRSDDFLW
jgi:hypothetical protein